MKSVKPGRGPSMMSGISGIFVAIFGVIGIAVAVNIGAPFFFPLFGVVFVILAVVQVIYDFQNATGKNRHSVFDIVDENEEPDPWAPDCNPPSSPAPAQPAAARYCPYCGAPTEDGFSFCTKCGKKLPEKI